ncbi:hypothetical protein E2562_012597 [Oryza meyeriana var. granulata]|uniref:Uncharacterized protein n=1 Tax=Oryza meyeriana var. granulata TaxID=110450 RepID=A0A6G1CGJ3_9ORYZ|nr:hypothetical protein E2562_012597 [Oryza meyeriana var. granulata]
MVGAGDGQRLGVACLAWRGCHDMVWALGVWAATLWCGRAVWLDGNSVAEWCTVWPGGHGDNEARAVHCSARR